MEWFYDLSLKKKLAIFFGVLFVLSLATFTFSLSRLKSLHQAMGVIVENRSMKLEKMNSIQKEVLAIAVSLRDMMLAPSMEDNKEAQGYMSRIRELQASIAGHLKYLEGMPALQEEKGLLEKVIQARQKYIDAREVQFKALQSGNRAEAIRLLQVEVAQVQAHYITILEDTVAHQKTLMDQAVSEAGRSYKSSRDIAVFSGLLFILVMAISFLTFVKSIVEPLKRGVGLAEAISAGDLTREVATHRKDETGRLLDSLEKMRIMLKNNIASITSSSDRLSSSSHELSATVQQMAQRVDDQAAKTMQVATASTQMSQTVLDIAHNASNIATAAQETMSTARDGSEVIGHTVQEVNEIAHTVTRSAASITLLGERSRQIGEIVNVIKDIADQTNLLALNAAIEAARAGEQGRGFAVVADEVRKLSERTSKATMEISTMITAIQKETQEAVHSMNEGSLRVEKGVTLVNQAGEALGRIVSSVTELQSMVQSIALATEEMSTVAEQVNGDIEVIATVAKEASEGSVQIFMSSSDMEAMSTELKEMVHQFSV